MSEVESVLAGLEQTRVLQESRAVEVAKSLEISVADMDATASLKRAEVGALDETVCARRAEVPKPQTRRGLPYTRNLKPGTRNPTPGIRNPKLEA